jgi:hypothetical protein
MNEFDRSSISHIIKMSLTETVKRMRCLRAQRDEKQCGVPTYTSQTVFTWESVLNYKPSNAEKELEFELESRAMEAYGKRDETRRWIKEAILNMLAEESIYLKLDGALYTDMSGKKCMSSKEVNLYEFGASPTLQNVLVDGFLSVKMSKESQHEDKCTFTSKWDDKSYRFLLIRDGNELVLSCIQEMEEIEKIEI